MIKRLKLKRRVNKALKQPMTAEIYARILTGVYMSTFDYIIDPYEGDSQDVYDMVVDEVMTTYDLDRDTALWHCDTALIHHRNAEDELNRLTGESE